MTDIKYDWKSMPRGTGKTTEIINFYKTHASKYQKVIFLSREKLQTNILNNTIAFYRFHNELINDVVWKLKGSWQEEILIIDDESLEFSSMNLQNIQRIIDIANPSKLHIFARGTFTNA